MRCAPPAWKPVRVVLIGASVLVCSLAPVAGARGQGITEIVAVSGGSPPEGDGTFREFNDPALNDAGQVAFHAKLTGRNDYGVYRSDGNGLVRIARLGYSPSPGLTPYSSLGLSVVDYRGSFIHPFGFSGVNEAGQVPFWGARAGDAGPVAGTFLGDGITTTRVSPSSEPLAVNDLGQVLFMSHDERYFHNTDIRRADASKQVLIAPRGGGKGDPLYQIHHPELNGRGQVAFGANWNSHFGFTPPYFDGIYLGDGGTISRVVGRGQTIPGGNGEFGGQYRFDLNDTGQVAFRTLLSNSTGSAIFVGDGSTLEQLAQSGGAVPGGDGRFVSVGDVVTLNNAGQVLLHATVTGTSGGRSDGSGLYRIDAETMTAIARVGQQAPGGGSFATLDRSGVYNNRSYTNDSVMNEEGQVAFSALVGGNRGFFLYDDELGLLQIARVGDPFLGSTIRALSSPLWTLPNPSAVSLNEHGQLAYHFSLADGRSGIAVWSVPEPTATAWITLGGTAVLLRRRRRIRDSSVTSTALAPPRTNSSCHIAGEILRYVTPILKPARAALLGVAVLVSAMVPAVGARATGTTEVVAVSGGAPPEGDGTFLAFNSPALNDAGQVAFHAKITGPNDYGIYRHDGDRLVRIARIGHTTSGSSARASALGVPERYSRPTLFTPTFLMSRVNDAGEVPFWGVLSGANNGGVGVFRGDGGTPTHVASAGKPVAINNAGEVVNVETHWYFGHNLAIRRSDGLTDVGIVTEGRFDPGTPETFDSFGTVVLNARGQVAFHASIGAALASGDHHSIFLGDGTGIKQIVRMGQLAPGGDRRFWRAGAFDLNDAGRVVFGTNFGDGKTAVYGSDGATVVRVAEVGQAVPGGDGIFSAVGDRTDINNAGQVLVWARITGTSGGRMNGSGLYRIDGETTTPIALNGRPVPGGDGTLEGISSSYVMNEDGEVAFSATLGGHRGIFLYDEALGVLQVVRVGDPLLGSTVRMFSDPDAHTFSNLGQVAFSFSLADGRTGIAVWSVPEPTAASIGFGIGALLLRRRRRC